MTIKNPKRTESAEKFTDLILEVFKLHGQLITAGDNLTREYGLSSARWKVLGAIYQKPVSVAQIARNMGLTRQNVQQIVNSLSEKELVVFKENPDHQRAKLIQLTPAGKEVLLGITEKQVEWANSVTQNLDPKKLEDAVSTIREIGEIL